MKPILEDDITKTQEYQDKKAKALQEDAILRFVKKNFVGIVIVAALVIMAFTLLKRWI